MLEKTRPEQPSHQQRRKEPTPPEKVSARGHTCVILVMNMIQFIDPADQYLFASVRGTAPFAQILREEWPRQLAGCKIFKELAADTLPNVEMAGDPMTVDETGYVTGVFRQNMLNYYSAPDYQVQTTALRDEYFAALRRNWQFKNLILDRALKQWEIYIRPTMTGMFVIRLMRRYDKAAPLTTLANDVIRLQNTFNVNSAIQEYHRLQENFYGDDETTLDSKRKSVDALLRWLGVDPYHPPFLRYSPLQWQLAMDVARFFVREVGESIRLKINGSDRIRMAVPEPGAAQPVHDSYVIYHLDELLTTLHREPTWTVSEPVYRIEERMRIVTTDDLRYSKDIRQHVANLLEGALLRKRPDDKDDDGAPPPYFPQPDSRHVDKVFRHDLSTWDDELCLLSSRAAVILPSRRAARSELYIATLPTRDDDTSVMYGQYWMALERMIEFVAEIRVLAQLLERASEDILQEFVITLRTMREDMLRDYLHIDRHRMVLTDLVNASANLSRLVSVCQSMSNPQVWSRAEYGADKAEYLLLEMKVSTLLSHTERNVASLTSLVNHVDELYLAGLSEDNNRDTFWLSLVMASLSLSIILFSLPSFWADIDQLAPGTVTAFISDGIIPALTMLGSVLAPVILSMSLALTLTGAWRTIQSRAKQRQYRKHGGSVRGKV